MKVAKIVSILLKAGIILILLSIFYTHYFLEVVKKFNDKNTYLALSQGSIRLGKNLWIRGLESSFILYEIAESLIYNLTSPANLMQSLIKNARMHL